MGKKSSAKELDLGKTQKTKLHTLKEIRSMLAVQQQINSYAKQQETINESSLTIL